MGNEASSRVASGKHGHTLISDAKFRRLYALALEHARHDEDLAAAMAGVAADLRSDDVVVKEEHGDFSEQVIAALGGAAGDRLRKKGRLTVIVCAHAGHDAIVHEAHQLADEAKLPVIFVEDWRQAANGDAAKKRASAPLPQRIGAMPAIPVDAEDVIAIYRVAHESMARAREGNGPTRIQCVLWPAAGASDTSDKQGDTAVGHLEQWLEARGLPAQAWRREILAELTAKQSATSEATGNAADDVQELRLA